MAIRNPLVEAAKKAGMTPAEVIAEWRRRRNRVYAAAAIFVPCLGYWVYYFALANRGAQFGDPVPAAVIAAIFVTAVGCICSLLVWRCPSCGRPPTRYSLGVSERLRYNNVNPGECVHCGAVLRD